MTSDDSRIKLLEQSLKEMFRTTQSLLERMARAEERIMAIPGGGGGGGGTSGVFFCLPTTLGGATGSWPSLTPSSQNLTVYMVSGTTISSVGTFTVYNWYPAAPAASKVLLVLPDGSGNYVAVGQSCT